MHISYQVRQVTLKAVLSQQAYLLFYTKLTPTQELKVRFFKVSNFFCQRKFITVDEEEARL